MPKAIHRRTGYACPPACRGYVAGCPLGAARIAHGPYTTMSISIRFASESKAKENENEEYMRCLTIRVH